jgi:hypothetical protein
MAARSLERGAGCMEHFRSIAVASPLRGASLVQPFMKSIPIGSPISAQRHGLTSCHGEWLIASQVPLARVNSRNPVHRGAGQGEDSELKRAERFNDRLALLGFLIGVAIQALTGHGIPQQLADVAVLSQG